MVKHKSKLVVSNRLLYTLIAIGLLAIVGVGVYAYNSSPAVPSSFGHSSDEVDYSNGISGLLSLVINGTGQYGDILLGIPADIEFDGGTDGIFYFSNTGDSTGKTSFRNSTAELLTILNNGNVGIGTTSPTSKLSVAGSVGISGVVTASGFSGDGSGITNLVVRLSGAGTCNSASDGLLRYQSGICSADDVRSSSLDMCMKISNSVYSWQNVKTNTWADTSCDTNGCPAGQQYYSCTGWRADPGCYTNQPFGCYCNQGDDPSICEQF